LPASDRGARDLQPLRRRVAAAALASTQILAPRFGRLLTWSLAAAGVNDWLQGFAALITKANELEQR
jgi:hypothetical protein